MQKSLFRIENCGKKPLILAINDFKFWNWKYEWGFGCKQDCDLITDLKNGTPGENFKAVDRSFDSFNASLGYKTNLAQNVPCV
jgi:iron complex outermembrane receptor protein